MNKINIITLGCAKNTVDSEFLIRQLRANSIDVVYDSESTCYDTIIINTCGFINDAKQESIDMIIRAVEAKNAGLVKNVFVMGCLSERYKTELQKEIPEVDQYFGVNNLKEILKTLKFKYKQEFYNHRSLITPSHYAYLKVSEGCNRKCAFCVIPKIRGKYISNSMEDIEEEAVLLAGQGVKELLLIAQDLSFYGYDLYGNYKLVELVEKLARIDSIEWIRLHYLYPGILTKELISLMKQSPKVCKYIDIPFQHISDNILKKMQRGYNKQIAMDTIAMIRSEIPEMAIRTTMLVGHPGETQRDFDELKQFVTEIRFDRLGVFTYSHEENTTSYGFTDEIPGSVKSRRAAEIMEIQQNISADINYRKIGKTLKVLIDKQEGNNFIGRTEFDSPEVDNEVIIENPENKPVIGNLYPVEITSSTEFELFGKIAII